MGDNWFWTPDRETAAANASNIAWRTRNLLVNPQAAAWGLTSRFLEAFGILAPPYPSVPYSVSAMTIEK